MSHAKFVAQLLLEENNPLEVVLIVANESISPKLNTEYMRRSFSALFDFFSHQHQQSLLTLSYNICSAATLKERNCELTGVKFSTNVTCEGGPGFVLPVN